MSKHKPMRFLERCVYLQRMIKELFWTILGIVLVIIIAAHWH